MKPKKLSIIMLIVILLVAACTRELAPAIKPLPTDETTSEPVSPTATPMPTATPVDKDETAPSATPVPPTETAEAPDPTSTPTATSEPPTPTTAPPEPTSTAQSSGSLGELWNLADVRYGVHDDRLRVVIEMVESRNALPYYEIQRVDNAAVPFPGGFDPAWGTSRIDLIISDLYAVNTPGIGQLALLPPENPAVTRISSYPTYDDARLGFSIWLKAPADFTVYELTNPVRIVIDILNPAPGTLPTAAPAADALSYFVSPVFAVALSYPANWVVDPGYTTPELGDIKFNADDGFFIINSADAESIDIFTDNEAHHKLQPYGTAPTIENLTIQGQTARLIWPSVDQTMPDQAALVVMYPQPVTISDHSNSLFVLYADTDHIREIADTLTFVSGQ